MSFLSDFHKNKYLVNLSIADLIAQRRILKAKMIYFQKIFEDAEEAELENLEDYGMLATIQAEMDYADYRISRCEEKIAVVDKHIMAHCIQIWKGKKTQTRT